MLLMVVLEHRAFWLSREIGKKWMIFFSRSGKVTIFILYTFKYLRRNSSGNRVISIFSGQKRVNNPTHIYLSDLRVYCKVEVYFRVTWSRMEEYYNRRKKSVDYAKTANVEFVLAPTVLFHGWLIYSYLQIFKLIKCKWLSGECADWYLDNDMIVLLA